MSGDAPPPCLTPLHPWHASHGGRMVDFAGWSMPVQYTTIIDEHHAVRRRVGLFDISHMGRLTIHGPAALEWLERTTTNHVARLSEGQIQYSLMADDQGGVIDDILVYRGPFGHTVVCNASNRDEVLAQLRRHQPAGEAVLNDRTTDTAMIAVQGPDARKVVQPLFNGELESLRYYHGTMGQTAGAESVISRTGYTGEDGFELIVGASKAESVWNSLIETGQPYGIQPCGLGARDTLRFEAAMPLYGHELSRSVNPYEAGLGWAVKLDKGEFIGREALRSLKLRPARKRVGLGLPGKRIARQDYPVLSGGTAVGVVTSGTFAPTLQRSLAMALVAAGSAALGTQLSVEIRGQVEPAEVIPLPFYRRGERGAQS